MKLPAPLLTRLSPLVEAARGEPLLEPAFSLGSAGDGSLRVRSELGEYLFDRERRVVEHEGRVVAAFDDIASVDIDAFPGGRGQASWGLTLYLSFLNRVALGRTYDDGAASVAGARLARLIGCKVVALALRR
ncbi:MAG: hypothetical protein U1F56_16470 [Rubrivivax sp.]